MNPGKYNKKISIYKNVKNEDNEGFITETENIILSCFAEIKTTKGYTLILNNTDFEKAYTNFTIRFPKKKITRDMILKYNNKIYTIEYLNNINEANIELEIQTRLVQK